MFIGPYIFFYRGNVVVLFKETYAFNIEQIHGREKCIDRRASTSLIVVRSSHLNGSHRQEPRNN
jgi:hypothetical protein